MFKYVPLSIWVNWTVFIFIPFFTRIVYGKHKDVVSYLSAWVRYFMFLNVWPISASTLL